MVINLCIVFESLRARLARYRLTVLSGPADCSNQKTPKVRADRMKQVRILAWGLATPAGYMNYCKFCTSIPIN